MDKPLPTLRPAVRPARPAGPAFVLPLKVQQLAWMLFRFRHPGRFAYLEEEGGLVPSLPRPGRL